MPDVAGPKPPHLSPEQLKRLWAQLANQEAPVIERSAPGLTDNEIDRLAEPRGVRSGSELRIWWGWRNGVAADDVQKSVERELGPGLEFLPLEECLELYKWCRTEFDDPEWSWPETWLPFMPFGRFAVELAGRSTSAVRDMDFHHTGHPGRVVAGSLGEVVAWWTEALESGAWKFDRERPVWRRETMLISPERDRSGLV